MLDNLPIMIEINNWIVEHTNVLIGMLVVFSMLVTRSVKHAAKQVEKEKASAEKPKKVTNPAYTNQVSSSRETELSKIPTGRVVTTNQVEAKNIVTNSQAKAFAISNEKPKKQLLLTKNAIVNGVIMSEILAQPRAQRKFKQSREI